MNEDKPIGTIQQMQQDLEHAKAQYESYLQQAREADTSGAIHGFEYIALKEAEKWKRLADELQLMLDAKLPSDEPPAETGGQGLLFNDFGGLNTKRGPYSL